MTIDQPEPVHVIANPNAAGGRGGRVLPELERVLAAGSLPYRLLSTEGPGHASELADEARRGGARQLLIVGGDGTIHEVVAGLLAGSGAGDRGPRDPLPSIAVLPVGTGNDFQRMIHSPGNVETVVPLLREGVVRNFDVGFARWEGGERHFVNLAGVGIDVEVLRRRPGFARLPGLLQYLGALVSALFHYQPVAVRVEYQRAPAEGRKLESTILMAAVTVGPSIGGGFIVSPNARADDGFLDLFMVERLGVRKIVQYLPGIIRGTLSGKPEVHQEQVTSVALHPTENRTLTFQLDGELIPAVTTFLEIRVLPRCLPVLELSGKPS